MGLGENAKFQLTQLTMMMMKSFTITKTMTNTPDLDLEGNRSHRGLEENGPGLCLKEH